MASGVSMRAPISAKLAGEAKFALKAYALVGLVGVIATFGAAKLGHPLFSLIEKPAETYAPIKKPTDTYAPGARAPEESSAIPIVKLFPKEPSKYQKVIPHDPDIVVGLAMFDAQHKFVGQVIGVHTAPVMVPTMEGGARHKEDRLFVTIEHPDGVAQMIDYGTIEWRALSSAKPEVGVITTSLTRDFDIWIPDRKAPREQPPVPITPAPMPPSPAIVPGTK